MKIVVIDYGMGNIASVANMVRKTGGDAVVARSEKEVLAAPKLILPGVGSFDHGISQLRSLGLFSAIREAAARGTPLLGICLGMQLIARRSDEGDLEGLSLIEADFKHFSFEGERPLRVPHVGWNHVKVERENALIPKSGEEQRYYFTHSYYAVCDDESDVLATAEYGRPFPAVYCRNRVFGVQFHPEKSHRFGMALIKRFVDL